MVEERFILHSPRLGIEIPCCMPVPIKALLSRSLAGWNMLVSDAAELPEVRVRHTDRYFVASANYAPRAGHADMISALNELLIAIAYFVKGVRPDWHLLHCAAYEDRGGSTVLFGERKSGKSVFIARKATERALIYSDDLLLWSPRQLEFISLGISPRLRRPVLPDIVEALGRTAFLAGGFACYLASDALDLAPAGKRFRPDQVRKIGPDGRDRPVRFYNVLREIEQNRIS